LVKRTTRPGGFICQKNKMQNFKKVKIIATTGPAMESSEKISAAISAGVDVFRINFSHCSREEAFMRVENIRKAEKEHGRPIAIMADLAGPKIRIGMMKDGQEMTEGSLVAIHKELKEGDKNNIAVNHPEIVDNLFLGCEVYLGDGDVRLEIVKKGKDKAIAKVTAPGKVRSKMGFSAHGLALKKFEISSKDKADIKIACEAGMDAIAASFIQTDLDIKAIRKLVEKEGRDLMLIAKIETQQGIDNAQKILDVADGIMVARGDLGYAIPMERVPHVQKELITLARSKNKPVITATQMLESMGQNSFPTRAEITDVANAVMDGTSGVMLSQETSKGMYPLESVRVMAKIARGAESYIPVIDLPELNEIYDAVATSAVSVAEHIGAQFIAAFTESGSSARRVCRHRPDCPILALTPSISVARRLCFSWGVMPFVAKEPKGFEELDDLVRIALQTGYFKAKKGGTVVIVAGVPFGLAGSTNLLHVAKI